MPPSKQAAEVRVLTENAAIHRDGCFGYWSVAEVPARGATLRTKAVGVGADRCVTISTVYRVCARFPRYFWLFREAGKGFTLGERRRLWRYG